MEFIRYRRLMQVEAEGLTVRRKFAGLKRGQFRDFGSIGHAARWTSLGPGLSPSLLSNQIGR